MKSIVMLSLITFSSVFSSMFSTVTLANFTTPAKMLTTQQGELKFHQMLPAGKQTAKELNFPPIILLGGGPGFSSWNLEPIQKTLSQMGFSVYLMDMRGIGENAQLPQADNPVQTWISDIRALQQSSQSPKVILAGHSWGALMAMLYARKYPNAVSQMLLLNPVDPEKNAMKDLTENIHARNQEELEQNWDDDAAWNNAIADIDSHEQARKITEMQITQVLPTYFYDYQQGIEYAKQFTHQDFDIDLNINAWKAYDANPVRYETIRQWQFPIDFIDCKQDTLMPQNLDSLKAGKVLRKIEIIDQCSHFPWVEQTEQFEKSLRKVLF